MPAAIQRQEQRKDRTRRTLSVAPNSLKDISLKHGIQDREKQACRVFLHTG